MVGPEGPRTAKIAVVGEAPGEEEVRQGRPFIGPAGKVLEAALRQAGITREEVYLTNLMQVRPPSNDFGAFYLDASRNQPSPELLAGIERVKAELSHVRPNVTLLCGAEPLRALTGARDITARRGYLVLGDGGLKLLPTYHPSAVLHAGGKKNDEYDSKAKARAFYPLLCFDVAKAKRESHTPALTLPKRELLLRPPLTEALFHLNRMAVNGTPVAFDIETERDSDEWNCIAFSDSPHWAMCLPTSTQWGVDPTYVLAIKPAIKDFLEDARIPKIAQNAQFDVLFLRYYHGIATQSVVFDTMTAQHTVYPELPKSLELLTSLYTDQPYYKDMEKIPPSLWEYNALDAAVTFECYQALEQELNELGVRAFYQEYVLNLISPLLDMQEKGVCVDLVQRASVAKTLQEELDDDQADLNHTAYGWQAVQTTPTNVASGHFIGLNAKSPLQLQEFLFDTLKLPVAYKRKTGKKTTDEDTLEKLHKKYGHPAIPLVLDIRGKQKLLSTYVLAPLGPDHRLRCSYVVGGTETGRLASRESMLGSGTNLQNVPKGVARRLLVPAPGLTFVEADLSQAEARIVAYLAQDERLIDLFTRAPGPDGKAFDIHSENAAYLFHYGKVSEVTKPERTVAKKLVHAANYGMGPTGFQDALRKDAKLDISKVEAERFLNLYHGRFPRIRMWHAEVEATLAKTRVLTTPLGRKRRFFARWNDDLLREAYAFVPQSTVADILNRGLMDLHEQLPGIDREARLVLTVHDSVVIECRPTHVAPVARLIKQCLERPLTILRRTCVIPCDLHTGPTWADVQPYRV